MPNIRKELKIPENHLWYFVGLLATDGCLSSDGRHIDITAKDPFFLKELKTALRLENKICAKRNGRGAESYHIQFANRGFYDFLLSVGLTPKKSFTIGKLNVPTKWFFEFARGVIDGDGSIRKWTHPANKKEQWSLRIYSASPIFIEWLKDNFETLCGAKGKVYTDKTGLRTLKFGKLAAKKILNDCYYKGSLSLDRKTKLAELCGSSVSGWSKSNTLLCVA